MGLIGGAQPKACEITIGPPLDFSGLWTGLRSKEVSAELQRWRGLKHFEDSLEENTKCLTGRERVG